MLKAASTSSTPYWMQPALTMCAPAHLAQMVPLELQHAVPVAHGVWLSVKMAPLPPPAVAGSAALSWIMLPIIMVHVVLPAGGRPTQCSWPSSSLVSQRVVFSVGLVNVSSKASSMKSHVPAVSAPSAFRSNLPAFMWL